MKPRSRPSGDKIERKPWLCAGAGGGCAGKKLDMAAFSPSMRYPCLKSSFFGERSLICITSHHPASRVVFLSRPVQCKESRIGKKPIEVPSNVNVAMDGQDVRVKGPLGELSLTLPCEVRIEQEESGRLKLFRTLDTKRASKMHGLFRTLTDNMVVGVSKGFEKRLLLVGVGFRAVLEENDLVLSLGFSHPVRMAIPEGMQVKVEESTTIVVSGYNKYAIGDFAATIRRKRPPEPYKGKGVRYADEVVRKKEGKAGKKK